MDPYLKLVRAHLIQIVDVAISYSGISDHEIKIQTLSWNYTVDERNPAPVDM